MICIKTTITLQCVPDCTVIESIFIEFIKQVCIINLPCRPFYINLKESWLHERTQMPSDALSACSEPGGKRWQNWTPGFGVLIYENYLVYSQCPSSRRIGSVYVCSCLSALLFMGQCTSQACAVTKCAETPPEVLSLVGSRDSSWVIPTLNIYTYYKDTSYKLGTTS